MKNTLHCKEKLEPRVVYDAARGVGAGCKTGQCYNNGRSSYWGMAPVHALTEARESSGNGNGYGGCTERGEGDG